jgi:hypothetical protein
VSTAPRDCPVCGAAGSITGVLCQICDADAERPAEPTEATSNPDPGSEGVTRNSGLGPAEDSRPTSRSLREHGSQDEQV